jgi:hypothetical protein
MEFPDDVFKYILEFVEKPLKKCESCNVYVATTKCDVCPCVLCVKCVNARGANDEFTLCDPCVEVKKYSVCEICGLELTQFYCPECDYAACQECTDLNAACYNCDENYH